MRPSVMGHRGFLSALGVVALAGCGTLIGIDDLAFDPATGGSSSGGTGAGGEGLGSTTLSPASGGTGGNGGAGSGGAGAAGGTIPVGVPFGLVVTKTAGVYRIVSPGQFELEVDADRGGIATRLIDDFGATPVDRGEPDVTWLTPGGVGSTNDFVTLADFPNLNITILDRSPVEFRVSFTGSTPNFSASGAIEFQANGKIWSELAVATNQPVGFGFHQIVTLPATGWDDAMPVSPTRYSRSSADGAFQIFAAGPSPLEQTHSTQFMQSYWTEDDVGGFSVSRNTRLYLAPAMVVPDYLLETDRMSDTGSNVVADGVPDVEYLRNRQVTRGTADNSPGRSQWSVTFTGVDQYFPSFHFANWQHADYSIYLNSVAPENLVVGSIDPNTGRGVSHFDGDNLFFIVKHNVTMNTSTTFIVLPTAAPDPAD